MAVLHTAQVITSDILGARYRLIAAFAFPFAVSSEGDFGHRPEVANVGVYKYHV